MTKSNKMPKIIGNAIAATAALAITIGIAATSAQAGIMSGLTAVKSTAEANEVVEIGFRRGKRRNFRSFRKFVSKGGFRKRRSFRGGRKFNFRKRFNSDRRFGTGRKPRFKGRFGSRGKSGRGRNVFGPIKYPLSKPQDLRNRKVKLKSIKTTRLPAKGPSLRQRELEAAEREAAARANRRN